MKKYRNFIGMDPHCKHCFFVVMNPLGKVKQRNRVKTNESELLNFIRSVEGTKALAFEETTVSQWLYILLRNEVDKLIVCDPAKNKSRPGPKTDFIEATEIADLLRLNRLHPVFHSDEEIMELRTLVSGYDDHVKEIVRTKNRLKAIFRQSGMLTMGHEVYADAGMIRQLSTKTQRFVAKREFDLIRLMENQKREYEKKFQQNLRRYKDIKLIDSIPGFGATRANQVVGIVVTPHRFPTKYNFFSYAMIVRHMQMSDGKVYGKKQVYGRKQLKGIFNSAACAVLRSNNAFRRKYDQMMLAGATDKAARNAVVRMLAATLLGVWKSGKKYNDNHREVTNEISCHNRT
jgi:transposase